MAQPTFLANIKGPKGNTGDVGPQGLPGLENVPTDPGVAALISTTGTSETKTALTNRVAVIAADKYAQGATLTKTAGSWTIGFGDSLTDIAAKEKSYFEQTVILSGQRVAKLGNAGVSGNTVEQMLARIDADVISKRPDRVLFKAGTNNMEDDVEYATGQTAFVQILDKLLAAGIAVAVVSIPPRTAVQAIKDRGKNWNIWCKAQVEARGLKFIDTHTVFTDAFGGWADATNTSDGIHLTEKGAKAEGQIVATALATIYPRLSDNAPAQTKDPYNMLVNPLLADANADGIPDSWTKTGGAVNIVPTSITDATILGKVSQLSKVGSESGGYHQDITTGFRVGDTLGFSVKLRNPSNMSFNVYLGAFTSGNAFISATYAAQSWIGTNESWATFGGSYTVPATAAYLRFTVVQFGSTATNAIVQVAEPAVRLVAPSATISTL